MSDSKEKVEEPRVIGNCFFCRIDIVEEDFKLQFRAAQPKPGGGTIEIPCHDACTEKNFKPVKGMCKVCEKKTLIVPMTELCGPCMFGEEDMTDGKWWEEIAGRDDVGGSGALH